MSEQISGVKNHFLNTFDNFVKKSLQGIEPNSGKFKIRGRSIMARVDYSMNTLYQYGGWEFIEVERSFVNYLNNTGKLEIDIEEAREYYGL